MVEDEHNFFETIRLVRVPHPKIRRGAPVPAHAPGRRLCALPPIRHLVVRVRVPAGRSTLRDLNLGMSSCGRVGPFLARWDLRLTPPTQPHDTTPFMYTTISLSPVHLPTRGSSPRHSTVLLIVHDVQMPVEVKSEFIYDP